MDKIFKNDTVMGFIALLTFALVAWGAYESYTAKQIASGEPK